MRRGRIFFCLSLDMQNWARVDARQQGRKDLPGFNNLEGLKQKRPRFAAGPSIFIKTILVFPEVVLPVEEFLADTLALI